MASDEMKSRFNTRCYAKEIVQAISMHSQIPSKEKRAYPPFQGYVSSEDHLLAGLGMSLMATLLAKSWQRSASSLVSLKSCMRRQGARRCLHLHLLRATLLVKSLHRRASSVVQQLQSDPPTMPALSTMQVCSCVCAWQSRSTADCSPYRHPS